MIRIETRAPRWVDDFWLRHALGVLFGAGQRVRLWTEYEPRAGSRDSVPTQVQGQHNAQPQRPPCEEQDFNFSSGVGSLSAQELSAIAQTAVGEASTAVYPNEVEAVITTIVMYQQRCACGTDQFYGERSPGCNTRSCTITCLLMRTLCGRWRRKIWRRRGSARDFLFALQIVKMIVQAVTPPHIVQPEWIRQ
jgi:hypothetical protein